jgi:hypothetical protein
MRITKLAVVAAGLTLGLAACSAGGTVTPGASGSSGSSGSSGTSTGSAAGPGAGSAAGSASPGVANSCVVGGWKSTGVDGTFDSNGAHGSITGGGGIVLRVAADGKTVADFSAMQPVTFTTSVGGTEIKGSFQYGGSASGQLRVSGGTANQGTWTPVGTVDWRELSVTVDLISPVQSRIFDHAKIADFVTAGGGQTGGTVDVQPILREATYRCDGNTLTLGPPPGVTGTGTWILTRT